MSKTPAPQPLTDEEVEEWEQYYSDPETIKRACYECFPHREALARIRADGRRMALLEQAVEAAKRLDAGNCHGYSCSSKYDQLNQKCDCGKVEFDAALAALEDKTK